MSKKRHVLQTRATWPVDCSGRGSPKHWHHGFGFRSDYGLCVRSFSI